MPTLITRTRTIPLMLLLLLVLTVLPGSSDGFSSVVTRTTHNFAYQQQHQQISFLCAGRKRAADDEEDPDNEAMNLVTKASWYGVELFGKVFGTKTPNTRSTEVRGTVSYDLTQPPQSFAETVQRIQDDNAREYFLSGHVDTEIYDVDCIFSDPFVSFAGRDRFVENLQNLGSFITQYSARTIPDKKKTTVDDDPPQSETTTVTTRVMVKLQLKLPWQPILAWPWGVTYTIDPTTYLITDHQESWDIEPWEGVKQIFRKPTTTM